MLFGSALLAACLADRPPAYPGVSSALPPDGYMLVVDRAAGLHQTIGRARPIDRAARISLSRTLLVLAVAELAAHKRIPSAAAGLAELVPEASSSGDTGPALAALVDHRAGIASFPNDGHRRTVRDIMSQSPATAGRPIAWSYSLEDRAVLLSVISSAVQGAAEPYVWSIAKAYGLPVPLATLGCNLAGEAGCLDAEMSIALAAKLFDPSSDLSKTVAPLTSLPPGTTDEVGLALLWHGEYAQARQGKPAQHPRITWAHGYLGQLVVILPAERTVIAKQSVASEPGELTPEDKVFLSQVRSCMAQ